MEGIEILFTIRVAKRFRSHKNSLKQCNENSSTWVLHKIAEALCSTLDRREQRKLCNLKWLNIETQEATLEAHHDKKKLLKTHKIPCATKANKKQNFVSLILSNCFCNATRDAFITNQSCDKFCDSFFFCSIQVSRLAEWIFLSKKFFSSAHVFVSRRIKREYCQGHLGFLTFVMHTFWDSENL